MNVNFGIIFLGIPHEGKNNRGLMQCHANYTDSDHSLAARVKILSYQNHRDGNDDHHSDHDADNHGNIAATVVVVGFSSRRSSLTLARAPHVVGFLYMRTLTK